MIAGVRALALTEVLAPGEKTPDELAEIANREHSAVGEDLRSALNHALLCGEALLHARAQVADGEWSQWCKGKLSFRPNMASHYMRLASYKDELPPEVFAPYVDRRGKLRGPTLNRTIPYLRGLPQLSHGVSRGRRISDDVVAEARRLHAEQRSWKEIGRLLGISSHSARMVCDHDFARRHREYGARHARRKRAAEIALREQERRAQSRTAATRAGSAIAELYAVAERMQDLLGAAHREASSAEARLALARAGEHYRKMRDEIVRGLGVAP